MQRVDPGIDVIVLDLNTINVRYNDYEVLTAAEKINRISQLITESLEKFRSENNHRMKIFVWREYGIADPMSLFCENETRTLLKEKMKRITQKYPEACIVSGTVASKKYFSQFTIKNMEKIREAYKHPLLEYHIALEKNEKNTDETIKYHAQALEKLDLAKGVHVLRNSSYTFQGGNIYRHDKLTPFAETRQPEHNPGNVVFRPSKGKTANPVIKLTHPGTGESVNIVEEICMEHACQFAKKELEKKDTPDKKPDLHIVMSATVIVRPDNICADYFIQADSVYTPRLIVADAVTKENKAVNYYQIDATQASLTLSGPLEDMTASHFKLNNEIFKFIDDRINDYSKNENDEFSELMFNHFSKLKKDLIKIQKNNHINPDFTSALGMLRDSLIEDMHSRVKELDALENSSFMNFFKDYNRRKELDSACKQLKTLIIQTDNWAQKSDNLLNPPKPGKKL